MGAGSARRPVVDAETLYDALAGLDRRLVAVAQRLDGQSLQSKISIDRPTRLQRERLDRLLVHVFQHQVHHRGQAHAMLSGTTVRPPQLDEFFSEEEAPLREEDSARLGWFKRTVWG